MINVPLNTEVDAVASPLAAVFFLKERESCFFYIRKSERDSYTESKIWILFGLGYFTNLTYVWEG